MLTFFEPEGRSVARRSDGSVERGGRAALIHPAARYACLSAHTGYIQFNQMDGYMGNIGLNGSSALYGGSIYNSLDHLAGVLHSRNCTRVHEAGAGAESFRSGTRAQICPWGACDLLQVVR